MRIDGATDRLRREHDQLAWHAWINAAMSRSAKKLPPLASLQCKKAGQASSKPSMEADIAAMRAWAAV
ncbi:MAG: hypothetical protein COA84_15100 [Robiginitomaculum sp.]|nr:MAG: hypothetical protein COA84_15100 [Robiginitomaculum sp.]